MSAQRQQSLATGLREIDAGHEGLDYLLNHIFEPLVECRRGAHACDFTRCTRIAAISRYLRRNFAAEEALMARSGYPGQHRHQADHSRVLLELDHMYADCVCADRDAATVRDLLEQWLHQHTEKCDQPLGDWSAERAGTPAPAPRPRIG